VAMPPRRIRRVKRLLGTGELGASGAFWITMVTLITAQHRKSLPPD
jgi:hypothetical protein